MKIFSFLNVRKTFPSTYYSKLYFVSSHFCDLTKILSKICRLRGKNINENWTLPTLFSHSHQTELFNTNPVISQPRSTHPLVLNHPHWQRKYIVRTGNAAVVWAFSSIICVHGGCECLRASGTRPDIVHFLDRRRGCLYQPVTRAIRYALINNYTLMTKVWLARSKRNALFPFVGIIKRISRLWGGI